jgi:hypothetical protein
VIKVVNKRTHVPTDHDVYIGRPSPLGNPYRVGNQPGSRDAAIQSYREWLYMHTHTLSTAGKQMSELRRIGKLADIGDVNLVCWCAPKACHGDVIKQYLDIGDMDNPGDTT